MSKEKILVIGANGQIGSVLTTALRNIYGTDQVIASDIREGQVSGPFEFINIMDAERIAEVVGKYNITQVYHLAAILSAKGEAAPIKTWDINMDGMLNVFEVAREKGVKKIFFPSTIAVFGKNLPRENVPQDVPLQPTTVYGISKVAGELWCQYYFEKYGLDIRSVRYPGVIGYQSDPGGGTTDYAVEIYHAAVKNEPYICFLKEDMRLPMLYMEDTINAAIQIMEAPADRISVRTSYNISGISFSPEEIYESIKKEVPEFKIIYQPDGRQKIAETWPASLDDSMARKDWDWNPKYDLPNMTADMIKNLRERYNVVGRFISQ